jgi:PAS domain S-box-containing protein
VAESMRQQKKQKALRSRLRWARAKNVLALEILEILNRAGDDRKQLFQDCVVRIRLFTGLDAVGIRLRDGEDFPYFVTSGFPDHLVEGDNSFRQEAAAAAAARSAQDHPLSTSYSANVLQGNPGRAVSRFSHTGTFWTNRMSRFVQEYPEEDFQLLMRNVCKTGGYQSVALIPMRSGGEIVGLLQLNDAREGCFTAETVRFFEGIGASIGLALERMASRTALAGANAVLRRNTEERTAELIRINDRLRMQIAERERIEEALQQSETRYRTLVETAREIIWTVDMKGRYTYVNPSVTQVLGYTPEEALLLDPLEARTPALRDLLVQVYAEELNIGEPSRDRKSRSRTVEVELRCKDGSRVWMEITATVLRGPTGAAEGILGVSREISNRKQIEEMKAEFMTTAAHELQTPLTSVIGYSELLLIRDDLTPEEIRDCLKRIHAQAGNLAALVSRLLNVWESDPGKSFPLNPEPLQLRECVEEIVDSFRKQSGIHQFETTFPERPIGLMIEKKSFHEVLVNILNNALKYSPEGGLIRLNCEQIGDRCQISVQDEGIGMTPDQAPRVFDRFYRADTSNTAVPGLGIGMSLVKNLIEAEGGQVWIESAFGKGTTVRLSLPVGLPDGT